VSAIEVTKTSVKSRTPPGQAWGQ